MDDGSRDETAVILDEYAVRDGRIRVIHQENAGVSVSRNRAMAAAEGDWIGFVDADDVLLPHRLEAVNVLAGCPDVDLIRLRLRVWDGKTNVHEDDFRQGELQEIVGEEVVSWGWRELLKHGWSHLLFVRRQVLVESRATFPDGVRMREDTVFCFRMLPFLEKVVQSEYAGYLYRQWGGSAIRAPQLVSDWLLFCDELMAAWKRMNISKNARDEILTTSSGTIFDSFVEILALMDKADAPRRGELFLMYSQVQMAGLIEGRALIWWKRVCAIGATKSASWRYVIFLFPLVLAKRMWRWYVKPIVEKIH